MTLYPRRDIMFTSVSGGCGASHTRTVTHGEPDPNWSLTCPACELQLKDDPGWSATRHEVPETPDEVMKRESLTKAKDRNLEEIQTYALAKMAGLDPSGSVMQQPQPQIVCKRGHHNVHTAKFCSDCGISLVEEPAGRFLPQPPGDSSPSPHRVAPVPGDQPASEFAGLTLGELRRLAEKRGLEPRQSKKALIEALSAA